MTARRGDLARWQIQVELAGAADAERAEVDQEALIDLLVEMLVADVQEDTAITVDSPRGTDRRETDAWKR